MKCYQDLREFLSVLEQQGQLLRIKDEVKFEPDLAAAACALAQIGDGAPAILFDKIAGCIDAQVVMNVHGSWPNHALALGMDKETSLREQFFEFVRRFKLFPGELERVASAPWQEVTVEKDINLYDLLAAVSSEPRRWRLLHRQGLHHLSRPGRLGQRRRRECRLSIG